MLERPRRTVLTLGGAQPARLVESCRPKPRRGAGCQSPLLSPVCVSVVRKCVIIVLSQSVGLGAGKQQVPGTDVCGRGRLRTVRGCEAGGPQRV